MAGYKDKKIYKDKNDKKTGYVGIKVSWLWVYLNFGFIW